MSYKEQLDNFYKTGLNILMINIANELQYQLSDYYNEDNEEIEEVKTTPEQFEELCSTIEYWYLDIDEIPLYKITRAVVRLFAKTGETDFFRSDITNEL